MNFRITRKMKIGKTGKWIFHSFQHISQLLCTVKGQTLFWPLIFWSIFLRNLRISSNRTQKIKIGKLNFGKLGIATVFEKDKFYLSNRIPTFKLIWDAVPNTIRSGKTSYTNFRLSLRFVKNIYVDKLYYEQYFSQKYSMHFFLQIILFILSKNRNKYN